MKIIVNGATGRMGQVLCGLIEKEPDMEISARISPDFPGGEEGTYLTPSEYNGAGDMIIDFSNHAATKDLLEYALNRNLPIVIATTGHTEEEKEYIKNASKSIPVFYSANMSIGIALLASFAVKAASTFHDADIEILEIHHNQKLDAPSGTALLLANRIKEARPDAEFVKARDGMAKRKKNDIGIQSIRLGNEIGTHEIMISTGTETIKLRHEAENRSLFAEGAISAAKFLYGKNAGLYNMQDMMN